MTNYKEILRLNSLGINKSQITEALGCSRSTAITVLRRSSETGLTHQKASTMSNKDVSRILFPNETSKPAIYYSENNAKYSARNRLFQCDNFILKWN